MLRYVRGQFATFPLTLTLSLREREQRAVRSGKPTGLDCSLRRGGFTLSPRERAVRGKNTPHRAARMPWPWRTANTRKAKWLAAIHDFKPLALPEVADCARPRCEGCRPNKIAALESPRAETGKLKVELQQQQTSARSWSSRFSVLPRAMGINVDSPKKLLMRLGGRILFRAG